MNGKKVVGLGEGLIAMLDMIIKYYKNLGFEISYCRAGEYLSEKIKKKGGLVLP